LEYLTYYAIFCITTALVTYLRIYAPAIKELGLHMPHLISVITSLFVLAIMAPIVFWLLIFFPELFKHAMKEQILKNIS
jgi:hypothetical protein